MSHLFATYWPLIWRAFWMTIKLSVISGIGALILGTILASMRVSPVPAFRTFGAAYVNIVRNTPLTLIILLCSFGLAGSLGFTLASSTSPTFTTDSNFRLAIVGFATYTAAFVCESLRAGINTVPLGQAEAARALGFSFGQNLRLVVLPQAFRAVIAPLGSVFIALIKNTTIASVIGVAEASAIMKTMLENEADQLFSVFAIIAVGFIILTLPTGLFFGWLGRRLAVKR